MVCSVSVWIVTVLVVCPVVEVGGVTDDIGAEVGGEVGVDVNGMPGVVIVADTGGSFNADVIDPVAEVLTNAWTGI